MRRTTLRWVHGALGAALALSAWPAGAQQVQDVQQDPSAPTAPPLQSSEGLTALSIAPDVAAAYETYRIQPIWFRGGVASPAVARLSAILKRAGFDGFAEGPHISAQIDAIVPAVAANPGLAPNADRMLSTAWVRYVQALKRPTTGMIYAYRTLKPHGTRTEDILLTTAAAQSVSDFLDRTSELNPIYAKLRDTAWAQAQTTGDLAPDPRLLANLDRVRSIPSRGRFALVDSGTQRLTLYEDGQAVDSMKVIVGTNELPTPLIASIIYYVTFNPYWHAPDHLVRKTIAPTALRQGIKYIKSHGYHVVSSWTQGSAELDPATVDWRGAADGSVHLLVVQDPGPLNSMGNLKFPFENPEGIYLHDTPNKSLFAKETRFLSNGCVRLEDARRFGRWLLGTDPVAPGKDPETPVQLPAGIPIILTYLTAQVVDGKITYLPDVYGWDRGSPTSLATAQ